MSKCSAHPKISLLNVNQLIPQPYPTAYVTAHSLMWAEPQSCGTPSPAAPGDVDTKCPRQAVLTVM